MLELQRNLGMSNIEFRKYCQRKYNMSYSLTEQDDFDYDILVPKEADDADDADDVDDADDADDVDDLYEYRNEHPEDNTE
jgi:hypothetical protein